jgi:hypothetical protein
MGGQEQKIIRAAAERREPIPSTIQNRPELFGICEPYWNAFWCLNRSRPIVAAGFGATLGRLTYLDKSRYAHDHELAETIEDLDTFVYLIDEMDAVYLELNTPKKPTGKRQ